MNGPPDEKQPPKPAPVKSPFLTLRNVSVDRARQALRLSQRERASPFRIGATHSSQAEPRRGSGCRFQSGLVLFHPDVFAEIPLGDAAFVLAHELMHLALDTHGRQGHAPGLLANFATTSSSMTSCVTSLCAIPSGVSTCRKPRTLVRRTDD